MIHKSGQLHAVRFTDDTQIKVDVLYHSPTCIQHPGMVGCFGLELTDNGLIKLDHSQQTTVPGIYACGDSCTAMRTISQAVFTGNMAAAMTNKELTDVYFFTSNKMNISNALYSMR